MKTKDLISIIIPIYNEEKNIPLIYNAVKKVFKSLPYAYEFIFIDDGSIDTSRQAVGKIRKFDPDVQLLTFSRNFGKEIALTAGLHHAKGTAALMIDADLQYPPSYIPKFIKKWKEGADIVIGIRVKNKGEGFIKLFGSKVFYAIMTKISDIQILPRSTDFRLLDRVVIDEFNRFSEKNRITRGLIDWLGFHRSYIYFAADKRVHGKAAYSTIKLIRLALYSFVSLSLFPLRVVGYFGAVITLLSSILGIFILIEQFILKDPLRLHLSGTAVLGVFIIFLVGLILIALGLITLYIANIHEETIKRPLYILKKDRTIA